MRSFQLHRASSIEDALHAINDRDTFLIAGGTELLNWMKEGIVSPRRLVDINPIAELHEIRVESAAIRFGALARMSDIAHHDTVSRDYAVIREALLSSASPQLRNMASIGGNLMQRTRCPYFRADVDLACNKRAAGAGCSALTSDDRVSAIFGRNEHCVATHPSDVAVALAALDATIELRSLRGSRTVPLNDFYRLPDRSSVSETILRQDELITSIVVPAPAATRTSRYLKIRERSSYEFAMVSAAASVQLRGEIIEDARVALGGVAHMPWRFRTGEAALKGVKLADAAAIRHAIAGEFVSARAGHHNGFKVELALRTTIRAIELAGGAA